MGMFQKNRRYLEIERPWATAAQRRLLKRIHKRLIRRKNVKMVAKAD